MNTLSPFHNNVRSNDSRQSFGEACRLSVVLPVYNEQDNLAELAEQLHAVLTGLSLSYEVIFVDDGSGDDSLEVLTEIVSAWPEAHCISFRKNYGQTAALAAGFQHAIGEVVVAMDADLQNDPGDIPGLLREIDKGADVVSGWRKNRQDDTFTRRLPSVIANKIINRLISGTGVFLHDYGCTLKAYRGEIVRNLRLYGDMHRFIPAFAAWFGVKIVELEVKHHPRKAGRSKYGMTRIFRVLLDFITVRFFGDYLTKPSHFFGKVALLFFLFGCLGTLALGAGKLFGLSVTLNSFLMVWLATLILMVQSISLGLLGEMHMRSYFEGQNKVPYTIKEIIGKNAISQRTSCGQ